MEEIIIKNHNIKAINYLTVCRALSDNIFSHKITHEVFLKMLQGFRKLGMKEEQFYQTIYKYQDLVLVVESDGRQNCFLQPVQFTHYDKENNLRFTKLLKFNLSTTRFKPSTDYHWSEQLLFIRLVDKSVRLEFEVIFREKKFKRDIAAELEEILNNPEYPKSISYKLYVKRIDNLLPYLELLKHYAKEASDKSSEKKSDDLLESN